MSDAKTIVESQSTIPRTRFRKLRIALSVFFGLLTVMLCVIWIASCWRMVVVQGQILDMHSFYLVSLRGEQAIHFMRVNAPWSAWAWEGKHFPLDVITGGVFGGRNFSYESDSALTTIRVPQWFPVSLAATLAGVPWLSRK